jgi:hypothetical protein
MRGVVELSLDHDPDDHKTCGRAIGGVDFLSEQLVVNGTALRPRNGITL